MDPNSCLYRALESLEIGERSQAIDSLESLIRWLRRGGFLPTVRIRERTETVQTITLDLEPSSLQG